MKICAPVSRPRRDANGGYAECMLVSEDFAYPYPRSPMRKLPLCCVPRRRVPFTAPHRHKTRAVPGTGWLWRLSAHLVLKLVKHQFPTNPIFVFTRSETERDFAHELGTEWTGGFEIPHPSLECHHRYHPCLDAHRHRPGSPAAGGRLVINAIRKESTDQEAC